MELNLATDWQQVTAEDIDRAVNGSISAGQMIKTKAAKTVLNRLLYALDRACQINEANPHIKLIIYNLHREMNGQPPLEDLNGLEVQIFNVFVPRDASGCSANELYVIEAGQIVRFAQLNINDDLFSNRLKEYYIQLCQEPIAY
jgi:hypothetical protein